MPVVKKRRCRYGCLWFGVGLCLDQACRHVVVVGCRIATARYLQTARNTQTASHEGNPRQFMHLIFLLTLIAANASSHNMSAAALIYVGLSLHCPYQSFAFGDCWLHVNVNVAFGPRPVLCRDTTNAFAEKSPSTVPQSGKCRLSTPWPRCASSRPWPGLVGTRPLLRC